MKRTLRVLMIAVIAGAIQGWAQEESSPAAQEPGSVQAETAAPESVPAGEEQPTGEMTQAEKISDIEGKLNGMEESYLETKSTVDKLKKIKVSGYVQAQVRAAVDTADWLDPATGKSRYAIGNFAGGAFSDAAWMQLQVRRGRVKVAYETDLTQAVIQLDCIPRGVTIKDAYLLFRDLWIKSIALKGGVFDRPFGYEISYSSSTRESPERSRLFQTLFPGERDLGFSLEYQGADALPAAARIFNLKAGVFSGNGIADEIDFNKDIIGRIGFSLPFTSINMAIDGGFSAYVGKVNNTDTTWSRTVKSVDSAGFTTKTTYVYDSAQGKTIPVFSAAKRYDTTWTVAGRGYSYEMEDGAFKKSEVGQFGKDFDRQYFGGDLQFYLDLPVIGGFTVRGEYIQGVQPGTKSSSSFYNPGRSSNQAVYSRNFAGYYLMYVQNINPIHSQFVLKYDVYDPNTDVKESDFTASAITGKGLSATDLAFSTIGVGLVYHWDENLKFTLYLDKVTNEKMDNSLVATTDAKEIAAAKPLLPYVEDLKDDVVTFRIQYKF